MATTITLSPRLAVSGEALAADWQAALLDLRVETALNVPGRLTARFTDPGYALVASRKVTVGAELAVSDPTGAATLFAGTVTSIVCEQREGEQPELVVVGHDPSHQLATTSAVTTFDDMKTSDLVRQLCASAGLSVRSQLSTDPSMPYTLQADTDLGLVDELVRRLGADWWAEGKVLHLALPKDRTSVSATLALGVDLRSFSASVSAPPEKVQVTGWDRVQQETVTGVATTAGTGVRPTADLTSLADTPVGSYQAAAVGARTNDEATVLSQALFDQRASATVEATGVAAGTADVKLGSAVEVQGAGPLDGTYPVTAVEHLYRPRRGWVTRFRSGDRRPAGLAGAGGRTAGGTWSGPSVVGRAGLAGGTVTNVGQGDQNGLVRVALYGTQVSAWARILATGGGKARGNVFIPEVGDEVLVAFEGGDSRTPVVIGGLYGTKGTIPTTSVADGKVQQRHLVSRLGHSLSFLDGDTDATRAIELVLADQENKIHLGVDGLTVNVIAGKPVTLTVGSTKVAVGQDGSVSVQAPSISLKADQQIQLQAPNISVSADAQLNLQGQATASLKGAIVQVEAEGELSAKGAMVMIN